MHSGYFGYLSATEGFGISFKFNYIFGFGWLELPGVYYY